MGQHVCVRGGKGGRVGVCVRGGKGGRVGVCERGERGKGRCVCEGREGGEEETSVTVWCGGYVTPPPSLQILSTTFSLHCRAPSHPQLHLPRPLLPEMAPQGYVGQLVES